MSRRLTSEELREADVELVIPLNKWHELPQEIKDTLRLYIDRGNDSHFRYTVPAYLVRDFEEIARRQEAQHND